MTAIYSSHRPIVGVSFFVCVCCIGAELRNASPSGHLYVETEEFFSLDPVEHVMPGFFGSGYRLLGGTQPAEVDKTVFIFGNPWKRDEYAVWVRAYTEQGTDRRVSVEWVGEEGATRLEPTHVSAERNGFRWERAGSVVGGRRKYYQLRLHAVDGSVPAIDAVLLTADAECTPRNGLRPSDDPALTHGDGEGSTRVSRNEVVAGSEVELQVDYTVGPSGIAEGGALRFFVAESWSEPQPEDPDTPGYVSVRSSRSSCELSLDGHAPAKRGKFAPSQELRHQNECFVRLRQGVLQPGDTLALIYRGRVQPYTQSAADFRNEARAWYSPALPLGVWTDANADGIFWPVQAERSHSLAVRAAPPARLNVVAPSIVRTGEQFSLNVAVLDEFRNPVEAYRGRLRFTLIDIETGAEAGGVLPAAAQFADGAAGTRRFEGSLRLDKPGAYAVRVRDETGAIEALSNPIRCVGQPPKYRIFWGDLHTHHRRCDGLRTFAEAAAHARDVAGLDLVALSPHACYITDGDLADLWRVDERFNAPERFVALFAYEWAAGRKGSSHSVIYSETPMPLCFRAWGGGNVVRGRPGLWELLARHGLDVVEVPHHVRGPTERNPRYQKALEIYSQWGSHEAGVVANFDAGHRGCVFGASDNHTGQPGLQSRSNRWAIHHHLGGLTAFLAPRLTRRSLFAAIDARRCYATSACRIIADFSVNGHEMGEEFTLSSPKQARSVEIEAVASTPISTLTLLRNGEAVRVWNPAACVARLSHTDDDAYGPVPAD